MTFVIREGDPTTTGGKLVKGSANPTIEPKKSSADQRSGVVSKMQFDGFYSAG